MAKFPRYIPAVEGKLSVSSKEIWRVIDREKLRQFCEDIYGVAVTPEAADYFGRLMVRHIEGFKTYLPIHIRDHRPVTVRDIYDAASRYFA